MWSGGFSALELLPRGPAVSRSMDRSPGPQHWLHVKYFSYSSGVEDDGVDWHGIPGSLLPYKEAREKGRGGGQWSPG